MKCCDPYQVFCSLLISGFNIVFNLKKNQLHSRTITPKRRNTWVTLVTCSGLMVTTGGFTFNVTAHFQRPGLYTSCR